MVSAGCLYSSLFCDVYDIYIEITMPSSALTCYAQCTSIAAAQHRSTALITDTYNYSHGLNYLCTN